ncbi:MAG TPA: hypothetical protein VLC48_00615, partial [Gemmatimonadota bacterium]|nr:hypothetical protein [Gemmatimonadota bacterium]
TSSQKQTGSLSPQEIQQIADYTEVYVGYRGVASGTGVGSTSRFAADQSLQTKFKLTAVVRVGD